MKMTGAIEVSQRFDPYVRVPGAAQPMDAADSRSETVRALLLGRTVEQVRSIIAAVELGDVGILPLVLRGLHQETDGLLTRRIVAMLAAYERFLTQKAHTDVRETLDIAFRPVGCWVGGQYVVTSPALLVVQSILYSHCEWFHEHLWEARSAIRAYHELQGAVSNQRSPVSQAHAQFVAGIIAHQTLLRTTWSTDSDDTRETYAFYDQRPSAERNGSEPPRLVWAEEEYTDEERRQRWAREAAGTAIARTLFRFLPKDDDLRTRQLTADGPNDNELGKRQLAAALILHALCLHCRHGQTETSGMPVIKDQALSFLDYLLVSKDARYEPRLAFLQYGRYVLASQKRPDLFDQAKAEILRRAGSGNANFMFVFQRVSSLRVWRGKSLNNCDIVNLQLATAGPRLDAVQPMVEETVGAAVCLKLPEQTYIGSLLGIRPTRRRPTRKRSSKS